MKTVFKPWLVLALLSIIIVVLAGFCLAINYSEHASHASPMASLTLGHKIACPWLVSSLRMWRWQALPISTSLSVMINSAAAATVALAAMALFGWLQTNFAHRYQVYWRNRFRIRARSFLLQCFSQGILHPKLYA